MKASTIDQLHDAHIDQISNETKSTWDNERGSKVFLDPDNLFSVGRVEHALFYDHAEKVGRKAAGRSKRIFDKLHRLHVFGVLRKADIIRAEQD